MHGLLFVTPQSKSFHEICGDKLNPLASRNTTRTHLTNTGGSSRLPAVSLNLRNPAFPSVRTSREPEHSHTPSPDGCALRHAAPWHSHSKVLVEALSARMVSQKKLGPERCGRRSAYRSLHTAPTCSRCSTTEQQRVAGRTNMALASSRCHGNLDWQHCVLAGGGRWWVKG